MNLKLSIFQKYTKSLSSNIVSNQQIYEFYPTTVLNLKICTFKYKFSDIKIAGILGKQNFGNSQCSLSYTLIKNYH